MRFDDLDAMMRVYETNDDRAVLPGVQLVARLDGRSFTRLTKDVHSFDRPFDARFRDLMLATTEHLMTCGFELRYGYTQSDEISLLFDPREDSFGRKTRKLISILAGEASAAFTLRLGGHGAFDCRLSQLPTDELVVDYFRWRQADAHRNALNGWCYWTLRSEGLSARAADKQLLHMSVSAKNEMLFQHGINVNDLPSWQKRGAGMLWETYEKHAEDPRTNTPVVTTRRRLRTELELPLGDDYGAFVRGIVASEEW